MERPLKIPPRPEEILLVSKDTKRLVRVVPVLDWDNTTEWTAAEDIVDVFQSWPFNMLVLSPATVQSSLTEHQRATRVLPPGSGSKRNKFNERASCTPTPPLHLSVKNVHYQLYVDRIQPLADEEYGKQRDGAGRTKGCRSRNMISEGARSTGRSIFNCCPKWRNVNRQLYCIQTERYRIEPASESTSLSKVPYTTQDIHRGYFTQKDPKDAPRGGFGASQLGMGQLSHLRT